MRSLTRDQVRHTFDLDAATVDALISSGRLLCHVRDGEVYVPLAQLEAFFRNGLMQVFRTEASEMQEIAPAPQREREREREPERAPEPAPPVTPPPAPPPTMEAPPPAVVAPEPTRAALPVAPPRVASDDAADEPQPDTDRIDYRVAPRYVPRRQIDGVFNSARFSIVQMSSSGLRVRHTEELIPGVEGKLSFALLNTAQSVVVRARVVWTSVARERDGDAPAFYISGMRVIEFGDRLARAIDILRSTHDLQPDRRKAPREQESPVITMPSVNDDDVALVMKAVERFATDPVEASRWQARARFALSDPQVRRDAPAKPRERDEVLAIWEFLDRQLEVGKIVDVVSWMRRTRGAMSS
jgi:hypothetical protein